VLRDADEVRLHGTDPENAEDTQHGDQAKDAALPPAPGLYVICFVVV
jgi:hypothetical protein